MVGNDNRVPDSMWAWTGLRALGGSWVVKSTVLVPILGYFIIFNDGVIQFVQDNSALCREGGCRISWKLYVTYFGLCSAAVGSLMFSAFCPHIIKRYPTSREFFNADKEFYAHHLNLKWIIDDVSRMIGEEFDDGMGLSRIAGSRSAVGPGEIIALSGVMSTYFNHQNVSRRVARLICFGFFTLAACLLAVPSTSTFLRVLSLMVCGSAPI